MGERIVRLIDDQRRWQEPVRVNVGHHRVDDRFHVPGSGRYQSLIDIGITSPWITPSHRGWIVPDPHARHLTKR
jgi:hypothetical protein